MTDQNKEEIQIPEKFKDLVSKIEQMSILDLSELVSILEKKFGVCATAPMVMTGVTQAVEKTEAEEKTSFNVILTNAGNQKIQVIKVLRELLNLGLKEAKDIVDSAPKPVKEGISKEEAEQIKKKLEEAGASVELK